MKTYKIWLRHSQKCALVDRKDWFRLVGYKWYLSRDGYAFRVLTDGQRRRHIMLHEAVMHCPETLIIDHRNRDRLDCRRKNLRCISRSQSQWNKNKYRTNTSGYKGVTFDKGRWKAQIQALGVRYYLGMFATAVEAAQAYDEAAVALHGEFAVLNFARRRRAA